MISICVVTYNHEEFIKTAIESIISQKGDFQIEVLIGNDCSTDKTAIILNDYCNKYHFIQVFNRERNIGLKKNFIDIISRAKGKYIATLEGDDYWIDEYKLKKQFDFLEENPDYVLVCTNALCLKEQNNNYSTIRRSLEPYDFDTKDLMLFNHGSTLTTMFRNGLITDFPSIYYQSRACDRRLYILLSRLGKCRYLPDVTAVYRIHSKSITQISLSTYSGQIGLELESIRNAFLWNGFLGNCYDKEVDIIKGVHSQRIVQLALRHKDLRTAIYFSEWVNKYDLKKFHTKLLLDILQKIKSISKKKGLLMSQSMHYGILEWINKSEM